MELMLCSQEHAVAGRAAIKLSCCRIQGHKVMSASFTASATLTGKLSSSVVIAMSTRLSNSAKKVDKVWPGVGSVGGDLHIAEQRT